MLTHLFLRLLHTLTKHNDIHALFYKEEQSHLNKLLTAQATSGPRLKKKYVTHFHVCYAARLAAQENKTFYLRRKKTRAKTRISEAKDGKEMGCLLKPCPNNRSPHDPKTNPKPCTKPDCLWQCVSPTPCEIVSLTAPRTTVQNKSETTSQMLVPNLGEIIVPNPILNPNQHTNISCQTLSQTHHSPLCIPV